MTWNALNGFLKLFQPLHLFYFCLCIWSPALDLSVSDFQPSDMRNVKFGKRGALVCVSIGIYFAVGYVGYEPQGSRFDTRLRQLSVWVVQLG